MPPSRPLARPLLSRRAVALGCISTGLLWGAQARAQAALQWDIATGYPESSFHVVNLHQFAKEVGNATGGKLILKIHAAGSLVKGPGIAKAISEGKLAGGEVFGPSLGDLDPVFKLDALPFFVTDYATAQRLALAARPTVRAKLKLAGYVFLYSVAWPPQGIFAARPINSTAELAALRIRENAPPVRRLAEVLGATPVTVETPDLATALAARRIDAVFTSSAQGVDTQMWQQLPYFYPVNAWLPRNIVMVGQKAFDALDPATRETVMKLAAAAETRGLGLSEANARSTLEQLGHAGAKVAALPGPVHARLDRAGEQVARETLAGHPELTAILTTFFIGR